MKSKDVLVTTTPGFDGVIIKKYLKPITSHVVFGMNLFKDFVTGVTDLFGGNSETYEKTLESINEEVIRKLQEKAYSIGANCVVGFKIDNDEISAKGKSMLMVSAVGTAVIAEFDSEFANINVANMSSLNEEQLVDEEELMKRYNIQLKEDTYYFGNYKYSKLEDAINYAKMKKKENFTS